MSSHPIPAGLADRIGSVFLFWVTVTSILNHREQPTVIFNPPSGIPHIHIFNRYPSQDISKPFKTHFSDGSGWIIICWDNPQKSYHYYRVWSLQFTPIILIILNYLLMKTSIYNGYPWVSLFMVSHCAEIGLLRPIPACQKKDDKGRIERWTNPPYVPNSCCVAVPEGSANTPPETDRTIEPEPGISWAQPNILREENQPYLRGKPSIHGPLSHFYMSDYRRVRCISYI